MAGKSAPTAADNAAEYPPPYRVAVTGKFLALAILSTTLLAFTVGRAARLLLLDGISKTLSYTDPDDSSMWDRPDYHELLLDRQVRAAELLLEERRAAIKGGGGRALLPEPRLADGKEPPRTVYSAKKFDLDDLTSSSSDVHIVKDGDVQKGVGWTNLCGGGDGGGDGGKTCSRGGGGGNIQSPDIRAAPLKDGGGDDQEEGGEEEHLPAGQHLLVDIKNVDGTFLNSEPRLAKAMVDIVSESGLTLLSYHCHNLKPLGVSCVGVLLESHISFHTWPEEGVITLDIYTCGSKPLVPAMPLITDKFAVPMEPIVGGEVVEEPVVLWSHKLRGFRDRSGPTDSPKDPLASDLGKYMLDIIEFDMKNELVSTKSEYQRIDIYEVIRPRFNDLLSYRKSISNDGSYESLHPELYRPDRVVFLDGVMQSTLYGENAYHEALVHPGMFAHPNPRRVAIIGGGEGATLREVLKHKTVDTAVMIEIDEVMVNVSHEYLPSWSDCSSFSSAAWCVEDPRADVRYEDALAWFQDRFTKDGSKKDDRDDPLDVIIMDALDPQDNVPFAKALYDNVDFLQAVYDAMADDGVIVMQLGESPSYTDPADSFSVNENRAIITELIQEVGFESIHMYEESHSAFGYPWSYLVAFKSYSNRVNWYLTEAEVEVNIHGRILPDKEGKSTLKYFDGATMASYQVPHKSFEVVFCRQVPVPEECIYYQGYHFRDDYLAPATSFEVRPSGEKGFGLYAKVDIPADYMLAPEESWKSVKFPPTTFEMMEEIVHEYPAAKELKDVSEYMHFYGFQSEVHGSPEYRVDSSITTFVNHGCDGSANMGEVGVDDVVSEMTADANAMPHAHGRISKDSIHHVAMDRHLNQVMSDGDYSMRDIKAGEEMLNNYLAFTGDPTDWKDDVKEMRRWCKGGTEKKTE